MLQYEGKVYARVSDIIKPFVDFGSIPEEVLNRKAAIGTRVHDCIQQEIRGDLPVVPIDIRGYFQSFILWRSMIEPTFLATEERIYCSEVMLTGCIDAVAKLENSEEAIIIDWKTSANESPITWPMQAHLYHYLLKSAGRVIGDRFLFVKLDRHGGLPKVFQYKFEGKLMAKCLQAIDDFWAKREKVSD